MSGLTCPAALDRVVRYMDGELGDLDARALEDHVETCGSCLDHAVALADVHRDLLREAARRRMATSDPIPALLARVRWDAAGSRRIRRPRPVVAPSQAWSVAAVAAVIAVCAIVFLIATREAPPRRLVQNEQPLLVPVQPAPAPPEPPRRPPEPPPRALPPSLPVLEEAPRAVAESRSTPPAPEPSIGPAPSVTIPSAAPAVARVERGTAAGRAIAVGDTLATDGPTVVAYPDGTRLHLAAGTTLTFGGRGKTLTIALGELAADVTPQRNDDPMTFATSGAEVRVVGTFLTVMSRPDSTTVTVEKGRVQVTRRSDRWSIPLREGQYVVVEPGRLPTARPLPQNLLADPGFEADGKGWEGIFNAALGRNFGGVSVVADPARGGRRSLQFVTQPTTGFDRETFQDLPVTPGETVELSGWIRTAAIGGKGVSLSLLWLATPANVSGDIAATVRSRGLVLREDVAGTFAGTGDWTRTATRAAAPPQARQMRVLLYADVDPAGPATAWFDDVVLRRFQKGR